MPVLAEDFKFSADGINVDHYKAGDEVEGPVAESAAAQGKLKTAPKRKASPAKPDATEKKPDTATLEQKPAELELETK